MLDNRRQSLNDYLKTITKELARGDATEHTCRQAITIIDELTERKGENIM